VPAIKVIITPDLDDLPSPNSTTMSPEQWYKKLDELRQWLSRKWKLFSLCETHMGFFLQLPVSVVVSGDCYVHEFILDLVDFIRLQDEDFFVSLLPERLSKDTLFFQLVVNRDSVYCYPLHSNCISDLQLTKYAFLYEEW
jgi:hypothetical protein